MKAMLLAAGLGTRLKPLTDHIPKPLIPVNGIPLIFYNLALLKKEGITDVVINLYHLGDQIKNLLGDGKKYGFNFTYSIEKKIMGTGGGIKKASSFLKSGPFFVLNADIIVDIPLRRLMAFHKKQKALASLVVIESKLSKKYGALYVDGKHRIQSILSSPPQTPKTKATFFSGVHVLSQDFFKLHQRRDKTCIVRDFYIPQLKKGAEICGFLYKGPWNDLGTMDRLSQTASDLKAGHLRLSYESELQLIFNTI